MVDSIWEPNGYRSEQDLASGGNGQYFGSSGVASRFSAFICRYVYRDYGKFGMAHPFRHKETHALNLFHTHTQS